MSETVTIGKLTLEVGVARELEEWLRERPGALDQQIAHGVLIRVIGGGQSKLKTADLTRCGEVLERALTYMQRARGRAR